MFALAFHKGLCMCMEGECGLLRSRAIYGELNVAGAEGVEPPVRVLETRGLPLTNAPV